jgi:beta-lactam-binding protein with PASTA domain
MKKNYTISFRVTVSRRRFWTVIVPMTVCAIIAGGVGGMLIVDRLVMPRIVGIATRGIVDVPNLIGKDANQARQKLYDIGLRLEVTERQYDDSLAQGTIMTQLPEPGAQVKKGRHICVTVSDGSEVAEIPETKEMGERGARKALREAGFSLVDVTKVYDEKCPQDQVIGTEPWAGVRTSRELTITLKVSKGPKPTHATVPNLIGEMLSSARQIMDDSGLRVGHIEYRVGTRSLPGAVVSQSQAPGASVPLDSRVDLVVAAGK